MGADDSKPDALDQQKNEKRSNSINSKKDVPIVTIAFADHNQDSRCMMLKHDEDHMEKKNQPKNTRLTTGMTREISSLETKMSQPGKSHNFAKSQTIFESRQTQKKSAQILQIKILADQKEQVKKDKINLQQAPRGLISSMTTKSNCNLSQRYQKILDPKWSQQQETFNSGIFLADRNSIFSAQITPFICGQIILNDRMSLLEKGTVLGTGILFYSNLIIAPLSAIINYETNKPFGKTQLRFSFMKGNRDLIKINKILIPAKKNNTNYFCLLQIHGQFQPLNCFAQNDQQLAQLFLQKAKLFRVQIHNKIDNYFDECQPLKAVFHRYFIRYSLTDKYKTKCPGFIFTNEYKIIAIQTDIDDYRQTGQAVLLTPQLIKKSLLQFVQPLIPMSPSKSVNKRFSDPINFRILGYEIDFITINDTRLYYDLSQNHTMQFIDKQYNKSTGKSLQLNYQEIKIPNNFQLNYIIKNKASKADFEIYLRFINKQIGYTYLNPSIYSNIQRNVNHSLVSLLQSAQLSEQIKHLNLPFIQIKIFRHKGEAVLHVISRQDERPLRQIINQLAKDDKYNIYTQKNIQLDQQILSKKPSEIKMEFKKLNVQINTKRCWISIDSKILVKMENQKYYQHRKINELPIDIASYSALSFQLQQLTHNSQNIVAFREVKNLVTYYLIEYQHEKETKSLYCSPEATFYSNNKWKEIKYIDVGQEILGVIESLQETKYNHQLVNYKLITKRKYLKNYNKDFYGFMMEISQTHSFIANNLIIHNNDTMQIKYFNREQNFSEQKIIKVFSDQRIEQYFEGYQVYLGGNLLNNRKTFADYNIAFPKYLTLWMIQPQKIRGIDDMKTCITISNQENRYLSQYDIRKDSQNWANLYLAIHEEKVKAVNSSFQQQISQSYYENVIIQKKQLLLRQFFYNNIDNNVRDNFIQEQYSDDIREMTRHVQVENDLLTTQQFFCIYYYTKSQIYLSLNKYLRTSTIQQMQQKTKLIQLSFCKKLQQSLNKLPELQQYHTVYRGQSELFFKIQEQNEIRLFQSYTSTSTSIEIASTFGDRIGVILVLNIISGKDISPYSSIRSEQQILVMPFTYFYFEKHYMLNDYPAYQYTEIPLPKTNSEYLIFWVDDNPFYNMEIKEEIDKIAEVIRVTSTKIMKIIIQKFLWIYELLGKQSIIISDMYRIEDLQHVTQAGAELYEYVEKKGISNKFIFYVNNVEITRQILMRRGSMQFHEPEIFRDQGDLIARLKQICTQRGQ